MWAQNQAILPKIGIVLGVVLTCWFLIAILATRIPWPATPTPVLSATATISGGATPAAPLTPTR
jgi:hypothetical protein